MITFRPLRRIVSRVIPLAAAIARTGTWYRLARLSRESPEPMVTVWDALALLAVAGVVAYFTSVWWAAPPVLLAAFFLWFFRDPERTIPSEPGVIVSPADGKVTHIGACKVNGEERRRISIFLNVFDVHVNRSPVAGTIKNVEYKPGKFVNAMDPACAEENEQNTVTVEGEGRTIIFKQIAGLLARRIVFSKRAGESQGSAAMAPRFPVALPDSGSHAPRRSPSRAAHNWSCAPTSACRCGACGECRAAPRR